MFVKRYVAKDMQEAMDKIRRELGNDAVILNSRYRRNKGFKNLFKKKLLEVMVAYDPKEKKNSIAPAAIVESKVKAEEKKEEAKETEKWTLPQVTSEEKKESDTEKLDSLSEKLTELQNAMNEFASKLNMSQTIEIPDSNEEIDGLYEKIVKEEVYHELAKSIVSDVQDVTSKMHTEPLKVIEQVIIDKIGEAEPIKLKKFKRNVIVLLGPTGVGKTTTLVKLAGHYACEHGLKVGFINTDTFRVAAQEQLKIYSEIMDIPCNIVYTPEDLKGALKEQEDRDLVLVDTAGKSIGDKEYKRDIEDLLSVCEPDEVLLTVSVTTGYKACQAIIENFSFVKDYKLAITKLDEVDSWGNVLNIIEFAKKPIAYITMGQSVPDDIEEADAAKIAGNIVKKVI
jgi:flagellar biosynthesis protein FlhF